MVSISLQCLQAFFTSWVRAVSTIYQTQCRHSIQHSYNSNAACKQMGVYRPHYGYDSPDSGFWFDFQGHNKTDHTQYHTDDAKLQESDVNQAIAMRHIHQPYSHDAKQHAYQCGQNRQSSRLKSRFVWCKRSLTLLHCCHLYFPLFPCFQLQTLAIVVGFVLPIASHAPLAKCAWHWRLRPIVATLF